MVKLEGSFTKHWKSGRSWSVQSTVGYGQLSERNDCTALNKATERTRDPPRLWES